jgi:hypothetical protein
MRNVPEGISISFQASQAHIDTGTAHDRAPGPITLSEKLTQMLRVPLLLQSFYESFWGAYEANCFEILLRSSNSALYASGNIVQNNILQYYRYNEEAPGIYAHCTVHRSV